MSEHRRGSAKVVPFPEAEEYVGPLWPTGEMEADAANLREFIDSGLMSVEMLIKLQRESYNLLLLCIVGMSETLYEGAMSSLRGPWAEFEALQEQNRERAREMLRRKQCQ